MSHCPTCGHFEGYFHRICPECHAHFQLQHERQNFCSARCRQRAHRRRKPTVSTMACVGCGQVFIIGQGTGRTSRTRYHSNACRQRAYRKRAMLRVRYGAP